MYLQYQKSIIIVKNVSLFMSRRNNDSFLSRTRICDLTKNCIDREDKGLDCSELRKFLIFCFFSVSFD